MRRVGRWGRGARSLNVAEGGNQMGGGLGGHGLSTSQRARTGSPMAWFELEKTTLLTPRRTDSMKTLFVMSMLSEISSLYGSQHHHHWIGGERERERSPARERERAR